jgi:3'(2'), 5'-bisphosphate nucleotidase
MTHHHLPQLLDAAIKSAITAGDEILEIYNDPNQDFSIEKKSDNSPLTIADKRSHQVIMENLRETSLPVLSEEGREIPYEERKNWDCFWLIDPLDGTKEFIKKNDEFTVNIALIENGRSVLGVVYVPVINELYFASPETGSRKFKGFFSKDLTTLYDKSFSLPIENKRRNYTVVASLSHMSAETEKFIEKLQERQGKVEVISKGSSVKICLVAEGAADIYPRFGPTMEWDTAAGHAIAKHAGRNIYLTDEVTELVYNKENLLNPWFAVE